MIPRLPRLTTDDMEMGIGSIIRELSENDVENKNKKKQQNGVGSISKCYKTKGDGVMVVPPSVFVPNLNPSYGERMGIPRLTSEVANDINLPCLFIIHLPAIDHWSLLVRTRWRRWFVVDSYLTQPDALHLSLVAFIDGSGSGFITNPLPVIRPFVQKEDWECGYLTLFAFDRLLRVGPRALEHEHARAHLFFSSSSYDDAIHYSRRHCCAFAPEKIIK